MNPPEYVWRALEAMAVSKGNHQYSYQIGLVKILVLRHVHGMPKSPKVVTLSRK
jgi:hypothetical protein